MKKIVLILICLFALSSCQKTEETIYSGIIEAECIDIYSQVDGTITTLNVTSGTPVQDGDVIAVLDNPEIANMITVATEDLNIANANIKKAEKNPDSKTYDQDLAIAKAEKNQAQANLDYANSLAKSCNVLSNYTGFVVDTYVNVGDYVPKNTMVATVQTNSYNIDVYVPESLALSIAPNDAVSVYIPSLEKTYSGTISSISPISSASPETNSEENLIKVTIQIATEELFYIPPGTVAEVTF